MNCENMRGLMDSLLKLSAFMKLRIKNYGAKIRFGYEKIEGWRGELPFYIFWCENCQD